MGNPDSGSFAIDGNNGSSVFSGRAGEGNRVAGQRSGTSGSHDAADAETDGFQAPAGKDAGAGQWNYGSAGANGGEGIRVGDVENLSASWEEAAKMNVGVEFSLFNRLRVQADYFHEKRTGIFLQRAGLPAIVGLSVIPYTNIGETMNQGFDGTAEYSV